MPIAGIISLDITRDQPASHFYLNKKDALRQRAAMKWQPSGEGWDSKRALFSPKGANRLN